MNCPECQHRLQQQLDGLALDDRAAWDAHLAVCPDCRGLFAAAEMLQAGLRVLPRPRPPEWLRDDIVGQVLARHRRAQRRRLAFVGLTLAASLLLGVALVPRLSRTPNVVADQGGPPTPEQIPVPPSVSDNVTEATLAVASLTRRTADETVGSGRLLLPRVELPDPNQADPMPPLEPPVPSLQEAGQGASTSLQPVTSTARRAINLFLRDLPSVPPSKTPL